ncbi:MAG: hypothetical protein QXM68_00855 [Candidatus Aenigmatarchaeota archaeon]|nr:hypothetical protein [Candidatus Aenigmarchaeota archaeon]
MAAKAQAKPDEFIWVLFAGILAIIMMVFFWGMPNSNQENQTSNATASLPEGAFTIGTYKEDVPRVIRIGDFGISHSAGSSVIASKKYIEVSKGIFEDKRFSFSGEIGENLNDIIDGWIVVDVLDTSSGNLIIKFNNEVVYREKSSPGRIYVNVDKNLIKNFNVIEISSGMPGLQFWSTSVYRIEKAEFGINVYGNVKKTYDFELYASELKNFAKGSVKFNVDEREGNGNLIIKINGKNFFNGIPSGSFSHDFEIFDVGLVNGINTIEFSTERDTSYKLDDVEILIAHKENLGKQRTFSFKITETDLARLQRGVKGKISFTILDSDYGANLAIKITDSSGMDHQLDYIQSYSIGKKVTVNFGPNDVKVGTNYVTFSVSGEGKFTLSNVDIGV